MAEFRNVSGQDRYLALPDWIAPRLVEAGATVEVDEDIACKYAFDQAGVWEDVNASDPAAVDVSGTPGAVSNPSDGE